MKWSRSLGYHRNAETVYSKRFFLGGGAGIHFFIQVISLFLFLSFFTFIGETIQRKTDWTAFFQGVNCYALQSGSNYWPLKRSYCRLLWLRSCVTFSTPFVVLWPYSGSYGDSQGSILAHMHPSYFQQDKGSIPHDMQLACKANQATSTFLYYW